MIRMSDETPFTRLPDLSDELWMFNQTRRKLLGEKPIDREGERALGRLLFDPPEEE